MWKAGQIVTIEGERYRIVKLKRHGFINCVNCDLFNKNMCDICERPTPKVPDDCYLKELHPKSQEG